MTSFRRRLGFGLVVALIAQVGNSAALQPPMAGRTAKPPPKREIKRSRPPAPASLSDQIAALGPAFDGKAGIAIISLRDGWEADWNARALFPQQSCSKLWVSITALDLVDRGLLNLNQQVTLSRADMTLFHQPLGDRILAGASRSPNRVRA